MNIKRLGRALICLLLIFCLILNIAPPKAEATGAGLAATLVGASSVSVAAPLAVGAGLIALGVMASEVNPLVFENVVNDAVDSFVINFSKSFSKEVNTWKVQPLPCPAS